MKNSNPRRLVQNEVVGGFSETAPLELGEPLR